MAYILGAFLTGILTFTIILFFDQPQKVKNEVNNISINKMFRNESELLSGIKGESNKKVDMVEQSKVVEQNVIPETESSISSKTTYVWNVTNYLAECEGCSGAVACDPWPDVRNGNIYFKDATYGAVRIIAADKSLPCGSIVKIYSIYNEPLIAIVLDRGGMISVEKKFQIDLLYDTTIDNSHIGNHFGVNVELLRQGW